MCMYDDLDMIPTISHASLTKYIYTNRHAPCDMLYAVTLIRPDFFFFLDWSLRSDAVPDPPLQAST